MTPWQSENTGDLLSSGDDKAMVLNAGATNRRRITPVMLMMLTQAWRWHSKEKNYIISGRVRCVH